MIGLMPLATIISTLFVYGGFENNVVLFLAGLAFNLVILILLYGDYRRKFILEPREYPVSVNPFWQWVSKLILVMCCIMLTFTFVVPLHFIDIPFLALYLLYLYCGFKFLYKTKRIYLYFLFDIAKGIVYLLLQNFSESIILVTIAILCGIITIAIPVVEFYKYTKGKYC